MSNTKVGRVLRALPIPAAVVISGLLVMGSSQAAFSGSSSNEGSAWKAGSISIGDTAKDNIDGNVLFSDKVIGPGYKESRCVTLMSNGDIPTKAKMYGADVSNNLISSTMRITVEKGSIDPSDFKTYSCETFHDSEVIYDDSLSSFGQEASDFSTGLSEADSGDYLPSGGTLTYRITLELPYSADNSVANSHASATFRWEAQS